MTVETTTTEPAPVAAEDTALARVQASVATGTPAKRADWERALREVFGLSCRQAKRFAAVGYHALDPTGAGDWADVAERVKQLESALARK